MKIKNILLLVCLTASSAFSVFSRETFTAKVIGVPSGDTVTVLTKDKRQLMIRLAQIDAPEKNQDFESEARAGLSNMVFGQTVSVTNAEKDCLDRFTGSVSFNNNDLSLWAVKSGFAWADTACRTNENLVKEESAAKEKKIGLWQNPNPTRPADFLKAQPENKPVTEQTGRRIFSNMAPTPEPIITPKGTVEVNMTLDRFLTVCGDATATRSSIMTTERGKSFSLNIPETKNNLATGCVGSFYFDMSAKDADFKLTTMYQ